MTQQYNRFNRHIDESLNKVLFSSPMRFGGMFDDEVFFIHHAFPGLDRPYLWNLREQQQSDSRYYYIMMFRALPYEEMGKTRRVIDYSYYAKTVIAALAVYYGKQFDFHGIIEHVGLFNAPFLGNITPISDLKNGAFNDKPRSSVSIDLNFTKCGPILGIFNNISRDKHERSIDMFLSAARLYLRALQTYHTDIEYSYIDLVVCGEIISNIFRDYQESDLSDTELQQLFARLRAADIEENFIKIIQKRTYQIKKKFRASLRRLTNEAFYREVNGNTPGHQLTALNIDRSLSATYDLRSDYTHSGVRFAPYTQSFDGSDITNHATLDKDRDKKYTSKALSFVGLERLIRFCLLRLLHIEGIELHPELSDLPAKDSAQSSQAESSSPPQT